jgi:hypothetical protein
MSTTLSLSPQRLHQRRLRETVKRLVIELGYLDHYLQTSSPDPGLQTVAGYLDTAITYLNQHLAS